MDWPSDGRGDKFREVTVSFLYDHPVASNWSARASLAPFVTPADARRTPPAASPNPDAPGGMTLARNGPPP